MGSKRKLGKHFSIMSVLPAEVHARYSVLFAVALCAVLLNAVERLLTRRTLRDQDLSDEFLLVYRFVCTALTALFAVAPLLSPQRVLWLRRRSPAISGSLLIIATGAMRALHSVTTIRGAKRLELSFVGSNHPGAERVHAYFRTRPCC